MAVQCVRFVRSVSTRALYAIAEWVDEAGLRQSRLVGFENVDSWADPLASVSAHQAQTAATGLKSFFVNKRDLGSLPAWLVLDNCCAAVAVAQYLDMACIRCGVLLIAIPLRHFVWPPDTRGKPNQQHVQPKEPRFVTPMEKVRLNCTLVLQQKRRQPRGLAQGWSFH